MIKQPYIIAIDLDGTVVSNFDDYDKISFELLKQLKKDNYIVIATGRPYRSSKYFYDLLELNTPIINYNGALVHNPNDKNFKKIKISVDRNNIIKLLNDNKNIIFDIFCEVEDDIYLWKEDKKIENYLHLDGGILHLGNFEETLTEDPNGAIIFSHIGSENQLNNYINNNFNGDLKIRFWPINDFVVSEIYSPMTSKANGLAKVCEYYGISNDRLISFGDGHNDIEMIEYSKIGVAMANSNQELLKIANHITKNVNENGVYHFLKEFFKL